MRKSFKRWELAGFLFTSAVGTLLHFLFDWSGGNTAMGAISAVNESTWEHMKILFIPVFLFTAVQFFVSGRERPDFLAVRGLSTLAGTALIPVLFYTYRGILGIDVLWVDIVIFFLAAAAVFLMDAALFRRGTFGGGFWQILGAVILWGMLFLFIWCTFHPPALNLWRDPVNGGYGIAAAELT